MKVSGTSYLAADRTSVWNALNDPAVLVRTIPGCQRLESTDVDAYTMTVAAGVGAIKGVYDGTVRLLDQQQPGSFRMQAKGAGAPGTIGADVAVTLTEAENGGTSLTYDADATVGGMIGGVGQRMLTGVSKKMAAEFFANVDAVLGEAAHTDRVWGERTGDGGPVADGSGSRATQARGRMASHPSPGSSTGTTGGRVFTAPGSASTGGAGFAAGVGVGAVAALAGALVGGWIAGRRHG